MAGEISIHYRDVEWEPGRGPGIHRKMLHGDREKDYTSLLKLDANTRFPRHRHPAGEELLILEGRIRIEGDWYEAGCYVYTPPDAIHDVYSDIGATMLLRMPAPAEILED